VAKQNQDSSVELPVEPVAAAPDVRDVLVLPQIMDMYNSRPEARRAASRSSPEVE
jgi:hypothetical protein